LLLFVNSCAPHHLLHSFPTRRSSDLFGVRRLVAALPLTDSSASHSRLARWRLIWRRRTEAVSLVWQNSNFEFCNWETPVALFSRSEEHTSELQSPYDLVCRLLLEKKK